MFEALIAAGESGTVITLSGEADVTCAAQLSTLITAQLSQGAQQLTIGASRLRFADSASIRVLTARTLTERGGNLVLLHPRQPVTRALGLMGADQAVTVR